MTDTNKTEALSSEITSTNQKETLDAKDEQILSKKKDSLTEGSSTKTTRTQRKTRGTKSSTKSSEKIESKNVDSNPIKTTSSSKDSKAEVKSIPEKNLSDVSAHKKSAKANADLKKESNAKVNAQVKPSPSSTSGKNQSQRKNKSQKPSRPSNAKRKSNRSRNFQKMSNAHFIDKVFQNSSETLSRALVRKEQSALLNQVLDSDVPISHSEDSQTPNQVMKMPKVPPETRPGRAAMFGNIPLSPLQYEKRHKSEDYSKAYLREKVYLDSDQAQRLFEYNYDDVNVSFSVLSTVLRRFDSKTFNEIENKIIVDLNRIQEHYRKSLSDVVSSLNECIKEENRRVAFHDHEREYNVPIHTPYSLRFITCFILFDKYVSRLSAALITGLVDYDSFDSCVRAASEIIRSFARDVVLLRFKVFQDLNNRSGRKTEVNRAVQMAEKSAREEQVETDDPHPSSKRVKNA